MIRILQMIGNLEMGGSQAFIMNIYRKINKSKFQFDFIVDKDVASPYVEEIHKLGGKIYHVPSFRGYNILQIYKQWNHFFRNHREYRVIHFHVRSYTSIIIPIAKKYGLYTIQHSHSTSDSDHGHSTIKRILERPLRNQADYLMACSSEAGKWLFGDDVVNRKNYKNVNNAIDGERFLFNGDIRKKVRERYNIGNDIFVIGNVGRMVPQKNQIFILEIFAELLKKNPHSRLILVGDGDLRDELLREANLLRIRDKCIFTGAQSDPSEFYQAMDVFLFPSRWEGLGIVAIEAQASGLPCVVSDKVPSRADIGAGLFHVMPLQDDAMSWAIQLLNYRSTVRKNEEYYLRKSGYEINQSVEFFEKFYAEKNGL